MEFPTTHWSEVGRAGGAVAEVKHAALGRLLERYLPALRAYLLVHKRLSDSAADDLLQGFACDRVVADELVAQVNRSRGRFRTFLLAALNDYARHVLRHEKAKKRHPETGLVSLDERHLPPEATSEAADAFEVAWARQVIAGAVDHMRSECGEPRRQKIWQVFEARVLAPLTENRPSPSYEQLRVQFGLDSAVKASNLVITGKRAFAKSLWTVIGEYAGDEAEVEVEMRQLWSVLARAGTQVQALVSQASG